jgi:hypothetical protein
MWRWQRNASSGLGNGRGEQPAQPLTKYAVKLEGDSVLVEIHIASL